MLVLLKRIIKLQCLSPAICLSLILLLSISCARKKPVDSYNHLNVNPNIFSNGGVFTIGSKDVYDLMGETYIVAGQLKFESGGKIINGKLVGKNAQIIAGKKDQIFDNIEIDGSWDVEEGFVNWFTNGNDPIANFDALCKIIEMDAVCVLDKMYRISTKTNNEFYNTNKPIRIKGTDKRNTGLILTTKHMHSKAYFRSIKGNNIFLQNLTLLTEDFLNGIKPSGYDYYFAWSYYSSRDRESKPDMDYFIIDSCEISGAISFRYAISAQNTTPKEMLNAGIDTIIIQNSKIEESVSLIELSNGRYDITKIENNIFKNIYGPVIYFPLGDLVHPHSPTELSSLRKSFVFKNNHVYNDVLVKSLGEGYMSSFVVKGAEITIIDNIFENILNDNDNIETVPFYTSALNSTDIINNKVKNCIGRGFTKEVGGSNSFLRIRGSKNVYVKNNTFELDKMALLTLGLLRDDKSNISDIDKSRFRFSMWSANLNDNDFESEYVFENNTFNIAVLNEHSIMSRSKINFINNTITINYLIDLYKQDWINRDAIHNGCLILFRDKTFNGKIVFKDNRISVNNSEKSILFFTKDVNDNKAYDYIGYLNNVFNFNGDISLALPRSKSIDNSNKLNGIGTVTYNEATTNRPERTIGGLNANALIENYKSSVNPLIHPKFNGSTTLIAENNLDTIINLMNIRFQDVYSNADLKSNPVLIEIDVDFDLKNKTKVKENYHLAISDFSNLFFINTFDNIDKTFPFWTVRMPRYRYISAQSNGQISKYPLVITSTFKEQSIDNNGFLLITNTREIASFSVSLKISDTQHSQRNSSRLLNHIISKK